MLQLAYGAMLPDKGKVRRSCQLSFPIGSARLCNARLSLRENMVFVSRLYGFDPKPVINFVNDRLGLGIHLDRDFAMMPKELKRSALFLMSYAMPFDVYCADGLPVTGSPEMRELLESLLSQRMETAGLLITSSSPRLLGRYCDTFFILKDHKILEVPDLATGVELLGPPPKGLAPLEEEEEEEEEEQEEFGLL